MTSEVRQGTTPAFTELKDAPDLDHVAASVTGGPAPAVLDEDAVAPAASVEILPLEGSDDATSPLVDCPGCGEPCRLPTARRASATAFCPSCDYPLFLAVAAEPPPTPLDDSARRRLPGVDGRDALGALPCPTCNEPNPPDPTAECLRCGADLTPAPPPPAAPPPPEPEIVVVREIDRRWQIATIVVVVCWLLTIAGFVGGIWWWG